MAKVTTKINSKSIINEIVNVAGVSNQNATNIFNLFSAKWKANGANLLTALDMPVSTNLVKKAAKKNGPKAIKKTAVKTTAKRAEPKSVKLTTAKASKKATVKLKKTTTDTVANNA